MASKNMKGILGEVNTVRKSGDAWNADSTHAGRMQSGTATLESS